MKKLFSKIILVMLSMTIMLSASVYAKENALERVLKRGKLIMATDAAWPPFEYMEGDKVVGADVDIAQDIANALGVKLEVINVPFDSVSLYLKNGEADISLAAITVTADRAETMEFSETYCDAYQYIIVKDTNNDVKTIDDLKGYIIGVHLGTTGDFLASDEVNTGVLAGTNASVQQYRDLAVAAMGLNAGDVQAIVCDKLLAENICAVNKGLKCFEAKYASGNSTLEQYAAAAAKGEVELIAKCNEVIKSLKAAGTVEKYILEQSKKASALNEK